MRLGFPVKVLGRSGLKSHDTRRHQNNPHLSVSLAYLRDIFLYLEQAGIHMYRMASELAPYLIHPDLPRFHNQIEECEAELADAGTLARSVGLRLSLHAGSHVVLNAPDEALAARSTAEVTGLARLLNAMALEPEAVVIVHVGGVYNDQKTALTRFVERYDRLPEAVQCRLVLEHDQHFSLSECYRIHQQTGIRLVYDHLHHALNNPEGLSSGDGLRLALSTWPSNQRPKLHFSSPRTEMRIVERSDPATGHRRQWLQPPLWTQHSDYVNPFEFIPFARQALALRDVDVMLEAKAKDLALLRLRADLAHYAPDLAMRLDGVATGRIQEARLAYQAEIASLEPPEEARVLVAVMNNQRDFEIARTEGWYRIPVRRAPSRVGADYLAFYQTRVFGDEKWTVRYYAPVRRYSIVTRAELLPSEAEHPRAQERYYKIEIGPLQRLPQPVPSRRLRRITFIPTTLERLFTAQDVSDLWIGNDLQERLWTALKGEQADAVRVDERTFVLRREQGQVEVRIGEVSPEEEMVREALPKYEIPAWQLRFTAAQVESDLAGCLDTVRAALQLSHG